MTDFGDDHWLILLEDQGPKGLGRVLGYAVFETEGEAIRHNIRGHLCDACGLFLSEEIPDDVDTEILTYGDFKASYGNRMPLVNRCYL